MLAMSAFSAPPPPPPLRPPALLSRAQRSCKEFQWQVAPLPSISLPLFLLRHRNFLHLSHSKGRRISVMPGFKSINKRSGLKLPHFPGGYGRFCSVCDPFPKGKGFQKELVVSSSLMNLDFPFSVFRFEKISASVMVEKARKLLAMAESKLRLVGILVFFWVCISAAARGERILGHSGRLPLACISSSLTENLDGRPTTTDVTQTISLVQSKEIDSEVEENRLLGKGEEESKKQSDDSSFEHLEPDETDLVFQNAPHRELEPRKDDSFKPDENLSFKRAGLDLIHTTEATESKGIREKYEEDAHESSFKDGVEKGPPQGNLMGDSRDHGADLDLRRTDGQLHFSQGSTSQCKHDPSMNEVHNEANSLELKNNEASIDLEVPKSSEGQIADMQQDLWPWKRVAGQKDEELELAYEEWKAKPYTLTVPLRIVALQASVPYVWLKEFMQSQGKRMKLSMEFRESLRDMITDLAISVEKRRLTRHSIMAADLVTVGDAWLGSAIMGGLIEPIGNADNLDLFQHLGPRWKNFLRRNKDGQLDPNGMFWGVPYRWGCTVIAYRKDKFSEANLSAIKDWLDIWRPELAAKVSMVDSPREVVGAILKSLGASYNCKDFNEDVRGGREAVKNQFLNLQKQVRLFDSTNYLKALGTGDVWVAVGWSNDIIPFARRSSNIAVVVPTSGTSIWADLWAIPAATSLKSDKVGSRIQGPSPLICQWLDFCLQPARTTSFKAGLLAGDSPLLLTEENSLCEKSIKESKVVQTNGKVETKRNSFESQVAGDNMEEFMSQETIQRSEFVEPLSKQAMYDYEWLFSDVPNVEGWPNDLWELLKGTFQVSWTRVAGVRF